MKVTPGFLWPEGLTPNLLSGGHWLLSLLRSTPCLPAEMKEIQKISIEGTACTPLTLGSAEMMGQGRRGQLDVPLLVGLWGDAVVSGADANMGMTQKTVPETCRPLWVGRWAECCPPSSWDLLSTLGDAA